MSLLHSLLTKLGLKSLRAERHPIRVFLLDDDKRRHRWFTTRFKGDVIDIANNVTEALQLLSAASYDAIFLDHDLHRSITTPIRRTTKERDMQWRCGFVQTRNYSARRRLWFTRGTPMARCGW